MSKKTLRPHLSERSVTNRVVARFMLATEHPSEEARRDYLKNHPGADPKNHTVKKDDGGGKKAPEGGGDLKSKADKAHKMMDDLAKDFSLDKGDVAGLKADIDKALKSGDEKKLQKLKEEIETWRRTEEKYKARGK